MSKQIQTRIVNKHDIEANWLKAVNFVPMRGELIIYDSEVDENGNTLDLPEGRTTPITYERFKIGDGIVQADGSVKGTNVTDLPFATEPPVLSISDYQIIGSGQDSYTKTPYIRFKPTSEQEASLMNENVATIKLDLTQLGNQAPAPYVWLKRNTCTTIAGISAIQFTAGGEQFYYDNYATDIVIKDIGNAALVYVPSLQICDISFVSISIPDLYYKLGLITTNIKNGDGVGAIQQNGFTYRDENGSNLYAFGAIASGEGAVAFGGKRLDKLNDANKQPTKAIGKQSFAAGGSVIVEGDWSAGFGKDAKTYQRASFAVGGGTQAGRADGNSNDYGFAFAEGEATQALGRGSHAQGLESVANGYYSSAEGEQTKAYMRGAHAEGFRTQAGLSYEEWLEINPNSAFSKEDHAAFNIFSHAEGSCTKALGTNSHAEGDTTTAQGNNSHAEGFVSRATGYCAHAEGLGSHAAEDCAHAEGSYTHAMEDCSHAEGYTTVASGKYAHAEGRGVYSQLLDGTLDIESSKGAFGECSHTEGNYTKATHTAAHAEGDTTTASGISAHAEGTLTTASGDHSHAEGYMTNATKIGAHVEGGESSANGNFSHAEGYKTEANKDNSHAEGALTKANGLYSHAEGISTEARGEASHAGGFNTVAGYNYQTVIGKYNKNEANTLFEIGNGAQGAPSNAFEVYQDGRVKSYATPYEDSDLTNLSYVNNCFGNLTESTIVTFTTISANQQIVMQNLAGMPRINWGDGTINNSIEHTYTTAGTYECKIYNVTAFGASAFAYCKTALKSITFANTITAIGDLAFEGCTGLTSIELPDSIVSIGSEAFSGCINIASVILPERLTRIDPKVFYNCTAITEITIPDSVRSITSDAFSSCSALTEVTLGDGLKSIGSNAFKLCTTLSRINFGSKISSIGDGAFQMCSKLESVVLPKSVKTIGNSAFASCYKLTSATIGEGVVAIGNSAFDYCTELETVTFKSSYIVEYDDTWFNMCVSLQNIYVPYGCTGDVTTINTYKYEWKNSGAVDTVLVKIKNSAQKLFNTDDLAEVASTGNMEDLNIGPDTLIIFDCGDADFVVATLDETILG